MLLVAAHCGLDVLSLEPSPAVARILSPPAPGLQGGRRGASAGKGQSRVVGQAAGGKIGEGEGWGWFSLQASIMAELMHFSQMLVRLCLSASVRGTPVLLSSAGACVEVERQRLPAHLHDDPSSL